MVNILDQIASSHKQFRPCSYEDFFALQLAKALDDTAHLWAYVTLARRHQESVLVEAYRITQADPAEGPALERFEEALSSLHQERIEP